MMNATVASGYKQMLHDHLKSGVVYAGTIIDRNFEDDMLYYITNSTALDELTRCGQVIQFNKPPRVGPWRDYELNQRMVPDQLTSDAFCITICEKAYKSIKVDEIDIHFACDNWAQYEAAFLDNAWRTLSELWHSRALSSMQMHVSARNQGNNAGRHRNINLGNIGNALHLTPDNIVSFFSHMRTVLQQAGRWYEGEMYIILPPAMQTLLLETMFAKQMCCVTGDSVLFRGMLAKNILGFTVIERSVLDPILDPATNRYVYPILAGWNEAYAFTGQVVKARIKEMDSTFGVTYDMLTVFGGGVIYPEGMAQAYVSFSTDGVALRA